MSKEVRAVLSHHSSALHGCDVIYSRNLQVQPIRKPQMLLKKVRLGLPSDKESGSLFLHREPRASAIELVEVDETKKVAAEESAAKEQAAPVVSHHVDNPGMQLVDPVDGSVGGVPVPSEIAEGLEAFDESSGSSSEDSDSSSSGVSSDGALQRFGHAYQEEAPEGMILFRHGKSQILHKAPEGATLLSCGCNVSSKFVRLGKVANFKYPHCLKCFPKDGDRIRSVDQMVSRLDKALCKAKCLKKS